MFILSSSSVCFPVYILSCSAVGPLQMGTGGHPFCLRLLPITDKRRSPGRCSSFIRVLPITSPGSCPSLVRGLPIHVHIYVVQAFLLFSLLKVILSLFLTHTSHTGYLIKSSTECINFESKKTVHKL